jgi:hypothetical protein
MICFCWKRAKLPPKNFQFAGLHIISRWFVRGNNMLFPIAYQNSRSKRPKWYAFGKNGPNYRLKTSNSLDCVSFQGGLCAEMICFFRLHIKTLVQKPQNDMLLLKTAFIDCFVIKNSSKKSLMPSRSNILAYGWRKCCQIRHTEKKYNGFSLPP